MDGRVVGLDHLPVELLYDIHTFACSSALPQTSRYLHAVLKSAPTAVYAAYLIGCYQEASGSSASVRAFGFLSSALRYPICNQNVLEAIFRSPDLPQDLPEEEGHSARATVLPRRLFRHLAPRDTPGVSPWTEEDYPLPFLRYLYGHPRIPMIVTDSYDGYALTRAVYADFRPLVCFLLIHGASPERKSNLAVTVAIKRKSLSLVRLLIERDGPNAVGAEETLQAEGSKKRKHNGIPSVDDSGGASGVSRTSKSPKRRKLGDRVAINPDMLKMAVKCDAREIVEYLMKEKGCIPDMQTVLMMSR